MRTSTCSFSLLIILGLFAFSASGRSATNSLARVAEKALAEGKDATLNVGFARLLGMKAAQPVPLKRLQFEKDGTTHVLNVVRDSPSTIILSEHQQSITTFYLTDRSGTLRRAVVNDGAIAKGGMTNLTLNAAAPGFEKQKKLWLQQAAQ